MDEGNSEEKSQIASKRQRDAHGRFLPSPDAKNPKPRPNPLTEFLKDQTSIHRSQHDELIDIHVGNPLRKITELLEDIKRQKAFSFTLKGSLGVAGIAVVIGTFGIFGGTKAFCSKGTQTKIGEIKELRYKENSHMSLLDYIPFVASFIPERRISRTILVDSSGTIIHLVRKNNVDFQLEQSKNKIITGNYDSCSETLTVDQQVGIEVYRE